MIKVLFVCLGNICRSPMAEGIFKHKVKEKGLTGNIYTDSAGTSAFHIGENPDKRMCDTALTYSIRLDHKARQFKKEDFAEFDYIIPMDKSNLDNILSLAYKESSYKDKVRLMREFDPQKGDTNVPDPYYGGLKGFDDVFQMLDRCCDNFLDILVEKHQLK